MNTKKKTNNIFKASAVVIITIALLLCSFSTMAVPSPTKDKEYNLVVYPTKGGTGTRVKLAKNYFKATAHEKDGYVFTNWVIKGKYIFQKGNLKSKNIKLTLRSDCEAYPYFKAIKKGYDNTPIKINKSPISPKTGEISNAPSGNNISLLLLIISFVVIAIILIGIIIYWHDLLL